MATILLVEDEKTMRLLTSAKLRNQFTILCACDGVEALEVLERRQVDLIIADVMMPRMDGYTLVKRLREEGNQLLDDIWGYDSESGEDTVKTHVSRLRNKLRDVTDFRIVTVKGLGYKAELTEGRAAT